MSRRLRDFTAAGSAGSFVACASVVAVDLLGLGTPSAADAAAIAATPAVARTILFIQPLLLRLSRAPRVNRRAGASDGGTGACALAVDVRAMRSEPLARPLGLRPGRSRDPPRGARTASRA